MRGKGRVCRGLLGGSLFIFVCELFITVTEACQGWDKGSAPSRGCDSGRTRRTLTAAAPEILLIDADLICHDCSVLAPLDCGLWSSVQRGSYFSWSDRSLCVFYPSPSPPPLLLSPLPSPPPFSSAVASLSKELICKAAYYESGVRFRREKARQEAGEIVAPLMGWPVRWPVDDIWCRVYQPCHATSVVWSNITALGIWENLLSHVHMHKFITLHQACKQISSYIDACTHSCHEEQWFTY